MFVDAVLTICHVKLKLKTKNKKTGKMDAKMDHSLRKKCGRENRERP